LISNHGLLNHDIYLTEYIGVEKGVEGFVKRVISNVERGARYSKLTITNPYDQSIFPLDIASPTFSWKDNDPDSDGWLVAFSFKENRHSVYVVTKEQAWTPDKRTWELIKANSVNGSSTVAIVGFGNREDGEIISMGSVTFSTSKDVVGAPIIYKEMPLPFAYSQRYPKKSRWCLGDVSSYEKPRVILKDLSPCGFCHALSRDGKTFGMDIDYRRDKGAYMLAPVKKKMIVSRNDIISWNDLPQLSDKIPNMGLFSKISPHGRYVITTINEKPFMAIMDDLYFSQLFFPITGILAYYSREDREFHLLPGADNMDFIQTSPAWSPDGKTIAFSRAGVDEKLINIMGSRRLLKIDPEVRIDELNKKYRIRYDIYTIPFNNGMGGKPEPLRGAFDNDRSNYFPRFSPDGTWIVFTQSDTGLVAQPSSLLYIVPVEGGIARKMTCNTALFNSWHSWSPNGKWLVFVSKVNTPYTELFLTHIDEEGNDSPPVLLSRFKTFKCAAVIPEFADIKPDAIEYIELLDQ
jgi:hypothetical protein